MAYLTRPDAIARRADPRRILPEAQSVLVVAAGYGKGAEPVPAPLSGRVSRYAWGDEDYHRWLLRRLKALVRRLVDELGPFAYRCYVDTGPILERAWAQAAGMGWIGKNTNLIHPELGSFVFLGVALLGVKLLSTPIPTLPTCRSCTRCLDACPTQAIVAPGIIDARRCLSYLTIEYRGTIPPEFRPLMGTQVLGCDVCQNVCPWNQKRLRAFADLPELSNAMLDLPEILRFGEDDFRTQFRRTPIWRATPEGLARNAAIVLGNLGDSAAYPHLERAARSHPSVLVREHARWALELFT
jgi:epoxyqueuosine reductase